MEFYDAVRLRHSVRSFADTPVERQKLERILDAAIAAPSARNIQETRFVVVTDPDKIKRLAYEASGQSFIAQAPVVICCCTDSDRSAMSCGHPRYAIDAAISLEHVALAAVAEGLGGCWIGAFSPEKVRRVLGIPQRVEVVELYVLGYPSSENVPMRRRKPAEDVVCWNQWSLDS
jgi:nitroreductase